MAIGRAGSPGPGPARAPREEPRSCRYPFAVRTDGTGEPGEFPAEIGALVRERTEARARHDWRLADELRASIEAAGWRIMDRGPRTRVSPAAPASTEVAGEVRYGSAIAVPSRLDEPATTAWTVVLMASEEPAALSRVLDAIRTHGPVGLQVVMVENDPSDAQVEALSPGSPDRAAIGGTDPELVRTSARLGYAAALNIGLRRAGGDLVILADGSAVPAGDAWTALAAALADPAIAAAGGYGLREPDEGTARFNALQAVQPSLESHDVTALQGSWLAFRRADYVTLGPLDEHFVTPAWLDVWWGLRLRTGRADSAASAGGPGTAGDDAPAPAAPRSAVVVPLPLERVRETWPPDRNRPNRRNMYRVLDTFRNFESPG